MSKYPEPAVIDQALREFPHEFIADYKFIAAALPKARRFFFTNAASIRVGEIIEAVEDLILLNHQFAIPPYETMYIDFNCRLCYKAANKRTIKPHHQDERVGYLIHKGNMWTFSRNVDNKCGMSPFRFEDGLGHSSYLWPETDNDAFNAIRKTFPALASLSFMLGTGVHSIHEQETFESLIARYSIHPSVPKKFYMIYSSWDTYTSSMGDLRNIIAILLLLNVPKHVVLEHQQPKAYLVKGKRMVYSAHSVVTINLDNRTLKSRRLFNHITGIKHRRHEVKGHFAHWHLKEGCTHEWPSMPELQESGILRWKCGLCGGWRTWRKQHERGDAALGWVNKDYQVEGKP